MGNGITPTNHLAVQWFLQADTHDLDELREITKLFVVRNFRKIRTVNRASLRPLGEHPALLMEIMLDAI